MPEPALRLALGDVSSGLLSSARVMRGASKRRPTSSGSRTCRARIS
jgi:hypothetical protein